MRILFITRQLPQLPFNGARMRTWQHIQALRKNHDVHVFCVHIDETLKDTPKPDWGAWNIHLITLGIGKKILYFILALVSPKTLAKCFLYDPMANKDLDDVLSRTHPDCVIFEEIWTAAYLPTVQKYSCTIILDAHNIETPLYQSIVHSCRLGHSWIRALCLLRFSSIAEASFMQNADLVWVCSKKDQDLLQTTYGARPIIHIIPNCIDQSAYVPFAAQKYQTQEGPTLLFCANFFFYPNIQAAHFLLNEIFPLIQSALPHARLLLVGHGLPHTLEKMRKNNAHVTVTGFVDDVRLYLERASISVAPLLQGGGTRLKILESFAMGIPVVSTPKGCEGLDVEHEKHLLIADDPKLFAEQVVRLWKDERLQKHVIKNAANLIAEQYAYNTLEVKIASAIGIKGDGWAHNKSVHITESAGL